MKNIHLIPTDKSRLFKHDEDNTLHLFNEERLDIYSNQATPQHLYITSNEEIKDCWVLNLHFNEVYFCKGWYGIQHTAKKIILTTDQDLIEDGVQVIDEEFLVWFVNKAKDSGKSIDIIEVEKTGGRYSYDMGGNIWIPVKYKIIFPIENIKTSDDWISPMQSFTKRENNIIDDWLEKHGDPEVTKQVEAEAKELWEEETLEEAAERLVKESVGLNYYGNENSLENLSKKEYVIKGAKWQSKRSFTLEQIDELFFNEKGGYFDDFLDYRLGLTSNQGKNKITFKEWFEQFKKK